MTAAHAHPKGTPAAHLADEEVVTRRRFTVDEYERMLEVGILAEDDRVELIDGEIIQKMGIGERHAACVNDLAEICIMRLAGRVIVSIQNPARLPPRS